MRAPGRLLGCELLSWTLAESLLVCTLALAL